MAKKSFMDNPALQYISSQPKEEQKPEQAEAKKPKGYKVNPYYIETKSRRLQLVLQPSLYKKVKKAAQAKKLSVNEYVSRVLEQATENE